MKRHVVHLAGALGSLSQFLHQCVLGPKCRAVRSGLPAYMEKEEEVYVRVSCAVGAACERQV